MSSLSEEASILGRCYEPAMEAARTRFVTSPPLRAFLDPALPRGLPEVFLICFSSAGVAMTAPVEGWIRRAGEKCEQIGLSQLGKALKTHAAHEADHHLMMIEDARALVARWNARHEPLLDADRLIDRPPSAGVRHYHALHERVIAGDAPYGQIAIEYEIEMLSVRFGPMLLDRCTRDLGVDVDTELSFLSKHVALDVGHTRFNEQQLDDLLREHEEFLGPLVEAGSEALDAYAEFLNDSLNDATALTASAG